MAICEPEVAKRNVEAARRHFERCTKLEISREGAAGMFRNARIAYNLALDAYLESARLWSAKEEEA